VRQLPRTQLPELDFDVRPGGPGPGTWPPRPIGRATPLPQSRIDADAEGMAVTDLAALAEADPTVPADEPDERVVDDGDALAISRLAADVLVVDGRPRYHVESCLHLLGRDSQRLPAWEAVELGFSPCERCDPVTALLAGEARGQADR
jgi:clumping factor A